MKELKTKLVDSILKSDLLILKNNRPNKIFTLNFNSLNEIIFSIKQLIKILDFNKKMPLFLVCQNKQYSILFKKYLTFYNKSNNFISIVSYKVAVTLKTPAIYILIDCQNSALLCTKLEQQSNSIIYLVEKRNIKKLSRGEYMLSLNITCIKQILFILTLIKKIKIKNAKV